MVAVDTSFAQSKDRVTSFVGSLIRHFDTKYAKLSIASFDNAARLLISTELDAFGADGVISSVKFGTNDRRTDLMLDMAIGFFEAEDPGFRKVLFIVAHGSTTHNMASMEEKVKRLKELGAEVFYMNAGRAAAKKEAMMISSFPKENHVFTPADDEELAKSSTYTAYSICNSDETENLSNLS